jgi:hypothetical protein
MFLVSVFYIFHLVSSELIVLVRAVALMMEAEGASETSVYFYRAAWHNDPEDSHLYTHCCENLRSKKFFTSVVSLFHLNLYQKLIYVIFS